MGTSSQNVGGRNVLNGRGVPTPAPTAPAAPYVTTPNVGTGLFTVDTSVAGNFGGQDLLGRISRAQWEHYKSTYLPAIEKAMGEIGNADVLNNQIARGEDRVNKAFANTQADAMNQMAAYNTQLDPDQMQSFNRQLAFGKDKALGNVRNLTREAKANRDMALIAGSAGSLMNSELNKG